MITKIELGRRIAIATLVGSAGVAAACASTSSAPSPGSTTDTTTPKACTPSSSLAIEFSAMYSAFVTDSNAHTFQVPAIVTGATGKVTWSASDPHAVTFQPDPDTGGTVITIKAAANVTITATDSTNACATAPLTVTPALEADWQAGNARYNNGVPVYPGCVGQKVAPLLADSGFHLPPPPDGGCPDAGPACTGCHGDNPTGGFFSGVQHTPAQTGGFTDEQLVDIFVRGTDPSYDTDYLPYEYWHAFHTWSDIATPEQQKAMIVYLRSLKPVVDEGGVNFGGVKEAGVTP